MATSTRFPLLTAADTSSHRKSCLSLFFAGLAVVLGAAPAVAAAPPDAPPRVAIGDPAGNPGPVRVVTDSKHDLSPPLREMASDSLAPSSQLEGAASASDAASRGWLEDSPTSMPAPFLNFDGLSGVSTFCCLWPDPSGDVGPHHYVQAANAAFQVFSLTGTSLLGPVNFTTLWAGFGGPCQTEIGIQPIVLYDQLADRWLLARMTGNAPPYFECIAISQTADPTASWYRYAFQTSASKINDLTKLGVWPDGYYMSASLLLYPSFASAGSGFYALERDKMIQGLPAQMQLFEIPPPEWGGALPSDLDGSRLPPPGAPNVFVEVVDGAWDPGNWPNDELHFHQFHVDWVTPANTTFNAVPIQLAVAAFDGVLCGFVDCVPQSGTSQKLRTLSFRTMFRLAYRNFGDHEALVLNHTVDAATDRAALRWYEIRDPRGNPPTIFQQSTFAPDTLHRWMGSMAMDHAGDIAIGYNGSSSSQTPDIRTTGRLVSDPANSLPQGEAVLVTSPASQNDSGSWGDYSQMTLDPVNDCDFWFTAQYAGGGTRANWKTRIGAFRFPSCKTLFADGFETGSAALWSSLLP